MLGCAGPIHMASTTDFSGQVLGVSASDPMQMDLAMLPALSTAETELESINHTAYAWDLQIGAVRRSCSAFCPYRSSQLIHINVDERI